jgi:ribonucleotide reductase beta subunit family protein with ferritin-like domain
MKSQLFVDKQIDFRQEPLWFSSGRNVLRTDYVSDSRVNALSEALIGRFWRHTDFTYQQDAVDYTTKMTDSQKKLFDKNFKAQTLADAIISRSANLLFAPLTNNPDMELWFNVFQFNESFIHSQNYGAVLKIIKPNASKDFDDIMVNDNIKVRLQYLADIYDKLFKLNIDYWTTNEVTEEHKKTLVLALHVQYILEKGVFQNSFLITFAFKEAGMMRNNSKSIQSIFIDEIIHSAFDIYQIKRLEKDPMFTDIINSKEFKDKVYTLYKKAFEIEKEWTNYLFEEDPKLPGLTKKSVEQFNKYNFYEMMEDINLEPIVDKVDNPFLWFSKYKNTKDLQEALQETEKTSYLISNINWNKSEEDIERLNKYKI